MISTVVAQAQTVGYTKTSIYDDFAKVGLYSDPNPADLSTILTVFTGGEKHWVEILMILA